MNDDMKMKKTEFQEVAEGIFRIPIPLPGNPLKELNAWLVMGRSGDHAAGKGEKEGGRNLLVDTGFNRPECEEALKHALTELGVDMAETDIFLTHLHSDHCGLTKRVAHPASVVYMSEADGKIMNAAAEAEYWYGLDAEFASYGFPVTGKRKDFKKHPGWEWGPRETIDFTPVGEGAVLQVGDYRLRCVWTPGHTPGHMCLYDEDKGILFCADHVLYDITPNITVEDEMDDPLRLYLDSLEKVKALDPVLVLTGHRRPPVSFKDRIEELEAHHIARLEEVIGILGENTMTAYEVAGRMAWDIKYDSWEAFPIAQKWFATGEAIAHLQYLYYENRVNRFEIDDVYYYSNV